MNYTELIIIIIMLNYKSGHYFTILYLYLPKLPKIYTYVEFKSIQNCNCINNKSLDPFQNVLKKTPEV